jgi:hypothetical protein
MGVFAATACYHRSVMLLCWFSEATKTLPPLIDPMIHSWEATETESPRKAQQEPCGATRARCTIRGVSPMVTSLRKPVMAAAYGKASVELDMLRACYERCNSFPPLKKGGLYVQLSSFAPQSFGMACGSYRTLPQSCSVIVDVQVVI